MDVDEKNNLSFDFDENVISSIKDKVKDMSSDDIRTFLYDLINKNETKEFEKYLFALKQLDTNGEQDLKEIINNVSSTGWPLIVKAIHKNNYDIVNALVYYDVCITYRTFSVNMYTVIHRLLLFE